MAEQKKTAVISTFKDGRFTYEQRWVDCGSKKCKRCSGDGGRTPSHGPYWYLCHSVGCRWVRSYIGKVLDLKKHRDENGNFIRQVDLMDTPDLPAESAIPFLAKNPSVDSQRQFKPHLVGDPPTPLGPPQSELEGLNCGSPDAPRGRDVTCRPRPKPPEQESS